MSKKIFAFDMGKASNPNNGLYKINYAIIIYPTRVFAKFNDSSVTNIPGTLKFTVK